jgi:hypothetical protein
VSLVVAIGSRPEANAVHPIFGAIDWIAAHWLSWAAA